MGVPSMPTYEYRCQDCGRMFVQTMTFGEHEHKVRPSCPKCKSKKVEQTPRSFQPVTAKKG